VVILAAIGGATFGDQIGYTLGRRYGPRLLDHVPERVRASGSLDRALTLVRRRGALAVVIGRWAAVLRALVPGIAGLSGVSRRRFTIANVTGGGLWASAVAVAGYLAGASYAVMARRLGLGSEVLLTVTVVIVALWVLHARGRARRNQERSR
jgi:undecaprenyl-diphosphatase